MRQSTRLGIIAAGAAAFVLGLAGPAPVGRAGWLSLLQLPQAEARQTSGPYAAYDEVMGIIKRDYSLANVDAKRNKDLTYAAISGMLASLNDPFTGFLDPADWQQMQQTTTGSFEGIGAVLEPFGKDVRVVRPIPGSPAYKAGVKAGDTILSVAQHNARTGKRETAVATLGKDINDVVKLIKGPRGTRVTISFLRKGSDRPLRFTIVRGNIEPPVVTYWMEDTRKGIGHIVLHEFNERAESQLDRAALDLKKRGMKSLVFDLRYNPGGLLTAAVDICSRFADDGTVVIVQEKNGRRSNMQARPAGIRLGSMPLVVLVNGNSASAAEIVAGMLKDRQIGTIVGEHTFGKGLVQTLIPLSDGSALRLTTAKYFTPSGKDINNRYDEEHRPIFGTGGIAPDVVVKQSEAWLDQAFEDKKNDTQLAKALDMLRSGSVKPAIQASR